MGTTTESYQRKKRETKTQKNRRKENNGKIGTWLKPGSNIGNQGTGGSVAGPSA